MKAGKVLVRTRLYLKDLQKAKYSDWEVYQGINDALRVLAEESAKVSDAEGAFSHTASLSMDGENSAVLPKDFIRPKRAFAPDGAELLHVFSDTPGEGEFSIRGGSLCSGEGSVSLSYYGYPAPVASAENDICLRGSMLMPLAKIAAACVAGADDAAVQAAQYFSGQKVSVPADSSEDEKAQA